MVFAVQGYLAFRNAARRDGVTDNIVTRLQGEATFGPPVVVKGSSMAGDPDVEITVRFTTLAAADSFWADVQAFVGTGVNGPVTGSNISRHNCPHDSTAAPCVLSGSRTF